MPSLHIHPLAGGRSPVANGAARADTMHAAVSADQRPGRSDPGVQVQTTASFEPASPPVDGQRLEQIRAAMAVGTYTVESARIADAMLGFGLFGSEGQ